MPSAIRNSYYILCIKNLSKYRCDADFLFFVLFLYRWAKVTASWAQLREINCGLWQASTGIMPSLGPTYWDCPSDSHFLEQKIMISYECSSNYMIFVTLFKNFVHFFSRSVKLKALSQVRICRPRVGYVSALPFGRWTFRRRDYLAPELFFLDSFFPYLRCFGL